MTELDLKKAIAARNRAIAARFKGNKKKGKRTQYHMYSKTARRVGATKRRKEMQQDTRSPAVIFNERVSTAKKLKTQRKKYTGTNERVGFVAKIPRDEKIKKVEKRRKVQYGGSNYWYV